MVSVDIELAELLDATEVIKSLSSEDSVFLSWRSNCLGYLERRFGKTDTLYADFAGIVFNMPPELSGRAARALRRITHTKGNVTKLHELDVKAARQQFFRKGVDRACEVLTAAELRLTKLPP
jgi:hypothetical protein